MRKLISLALVAFCAIGWVGLAQMFLQQDDVYEESLAQARAMAERGVPYRAAQYYGKALSETAEQDVYREYLTQLKALNSNAIYYDGLADYLERYPEDTAFYAELMQHYYEKNRDDALFELYKTAKENNAVTEEMTDLYKQVYYTVKTVSGGYEQADSFVGDYAVVTVAGKQGIVGSSGQSIVSPAYDFVDLLLGTVYPVTDESGSYLMGVNGEKMMVPSKPVDRIYTPSEGVCVVVKDGKYSLCDTNLNIGDSFPYDYLTTSSNQTMAAKKDGKWALLSSKSGTIEKLSDFIYEDVLVDEDRNSCIRNGVIFAKLNGKYIMLNSDGVQIGTEQFDEVKGFAGSQPAAVRQGNKWGFVNSDGTINGAVKYDEIGSFSMGLYAAKENDKWGFKEPAGNFVIKPQYDEVKPFSANGIAAVRIGDVWSYITVKGFQ